MVIITKGEVHVREDPAPLVPAGRGERAARSELEGVPVWRGRHTDEVQDATLSGCFEANTSAIGNFYTGEDKVWTLTSRRRSSIFWQSRIFARAHRYAGENLTFQVAANLATPGM